MLRKEQIQNNSILLEAGGSFFVRAWIVGVRLLWVFTLARIVTTQRFGELSIALAVAELFRLVADLGVEQYTIRRAALNQQYPIKQYRLLAAAFPQRLAAGAIMLPIYWLVVGLFFRGIDLELGLIGVLIITQLFIGLALAYHQGIGVVHRLFAPIVVPGIIVIAALSVGHFMKPLGELALISAMVGYELLTVGLIYYATDMRNALMRPWRTASVLTLIKGSRSLAINAVVIAIYSRMDIFAVGNYLGSLQAGNYNVAYRLTEPFRFAGGIVDMMVYRRSAVMSRRSNRATISLLVLGRLLAVPCILGFLAAIFVVGASSHILQWFFPNYSDAEAVARILGVALFFRFLNGGMAAISYGFGLAHVYTRLVLFNLLIMSCGLLVFIPLMGLTGAATALLVMEAVNTIRQWGILRSIK